MGTAPLEEGELDAPDLGAGLLLDRVGQQGSGSGVLCLGGKGGGGRKTGFVQHIQRQQGFDLERYAGKRAKRYTYEILNYPSGETGVQANLLLYKTTVIGGEVLSPRLDGFLHGLAMPETGDAGG